MQTRAALLLALLLASAARASEADTPPPAADTKSPSTALMASLLTTAAGVGTLAFAGTADSHLLMGNEGAWLAGGLVLLAAGPTMGHAYAGNTWNTGLKWRLASLGIGAAALTGALATCEPFSRCSEVGEQVSGTLIVVASAASLSYGIATIYEIATAPRSARRYNEKQRLSIVPAAGAQPGVSLVGTF